MLEVLFAIIPVFLVILLGLILDRWEVLPAPTSMVLSIYVLRVALPMLLVHLLAGAEPGDLARGGFWFAILGGQMCVYGIGYFGELFIARRGQGPAVVTAMSCSCCNAAFLGLPIVANLLPGNQEAMLVAGLATIAPTVIMAMGQPHLEMLVQRAKGNAQDMGALRTWPILKKAILFNPLVQGMVVGMILCALGIGLWTPLDRAAGLIGATSAPCVLLALGLDIRSKLRVALKGAGQGKLVRQASIALIKLVVHPLLVWGLLILCGVSGLWLAVGVIMTGTATAVGAYVVAEVYGFVPEESALSTVLTNGLSLFTMSAFAYIFKTMGLI